MTQTALNWQSGQNESLRHQIGHGSWTLPEDALLESILSEHAKVCVAVETLFEEEKFSSVDYEAAQLTAMLRSYASKRAMLRSVAETGQFRFWPVWSLLHGWGIDDPEVAAALEPLLRIPPEERQHSAYHVPAIVGLERRIESREDEIADLRLSLRRSHEHRERIEARHQDEINWLKQDIDQGRSQIVKVSRKDDRAAESLRKQFDQRLAAARRLVEAREATIEWLRERNGRLRAAVVRATELIASLREKNARLRAEVRDLKGESAALASRVETLQAQLDKLRSTRSVLSKALYGSRS